MNKENEKIELDRVVVSTGKGATKSVSQGKERLAGKAGILARLKRVKHIEFYIAGGAIAIMLLIYFSAIMVGGRASTPIDNGPPEVSFSDFHRRTSADVHRVVRSIRGVGRAEVAISWETSVELVLAYITVNNNGNISTTPQLVTENGVTRPIVIKEIYPQAIGVAIVAEGGDDIRVRLSIIDTVSVLLRIPQERIIVQPM